MPDVSRQEASGTTAGGDRGDAATSSTPTQSSSRARPRPSNPIASSSSLIPSHKLHRPYRIQVHEVTPVSITLLWSLRPPPIAPEELKRGRRNRLAAMAAGGEAAKTSSGTQADGDDVTEEEGEEEEDEEEQDHDDDAEHDDDDDEADDWPSDDGATAVDQSSDRDESGAEEGPTEPANGSTSHRNGRRQGFPSSISVSVNGVPWTHVVLGDRENDEVVIVIYGLLPSHEYHIELGIGSGEKTLATLSANAATEAEGGGIGTSTVDPTVSAPGPVSTSSVMQTPEHSRSSSLAGALSLPGSTGTSSPTLARVLASGTLDGADAGTTLTSLSESNSPVLAATGAATNKAARLRAESATLAALRDSLTTELRRARKEASRAESTLRNEIEAIKRGLERMSGADHRSKQKVLALQESIRQATLHAKELDEEANEAEKEKPKWEDKEREANEAWETVRDEVEAKERDVDQAVKEDKGELDEQEKELEKLKERIAAKEAERDRLRDDEVAKLEEKLKRLRSDAENARKEPVPREMLRSVEVNHQIQIQQIQQQHAGPHHAQHYGVGGAGIPPFVPSQVRGRGRGAARGGGRGAGGPYHRGRGPRGGAGGAHASGAFAHGPHGNQHGPHFDPDASFGSANDGHGTPMLSNDAFVGGHLHHLTLNPNNAEFVPSGTNTATASPVLNKARGSGEAGWGISGSNASATGGGAIGLGMGPPPSGPARLGFPSTDPRAPHRAASGPSAFADSSVAGASANSLAPIGASRSAHNSPRLGHSNVAVGAGPIPSLAAPGQPGSNAPSPSLLHRQAVGVLPSLDFASADGGYRRGSLGPASPTRLSPSPNVGNGTSGVAGGGGGSNGTSPIGVPPPPTGPAGIWSSASPVSSPWSGTVALPHVGGGGGGGPGGSTSDIWSSFSSSSPMSQPPPPPPPPIGSSPSNSVVGHGSISGSPNGAQPLSGTAPGLRLVQQQHQHGPRHKPSFPSALSGQRRGAAAGAATRMGSGSEGAAPGPGPSNVAQGMPAGVIGGVNALVRAGSAPVSPVTSNPNQMEGEAKGVGIPPPNASQPLVLPPAAATGNVAPSSTSSSPTQPPHTNSSAASASAVAQGTAPSNRQSPGPLSFASVAAMRDAEARREASV